jgi:hypothetical protein
MDASNLDMLAMMAFLRDAPAIGVHVPGRPDITGAELQRGIRFMFDRVPLNLPKLPPLVDVTPAPAKAKRGRPAKAAKAVQPGSAGAWVLRPDRASRKRCAQHHPDPGLRSHYG